MKALSYCCAALLIAGVVWSVAFAAFEWAAARPGAPPTAADGIVALTGGADRIETALRLLGDGTAPLLLVSGVGRGTDLGEMLRRVPLSPELAARVTLGRDAATTLGNAVETASWVKARGIRHLIVVTAGYHMGRALLEIGRALPDVVLYPVMVHPSALRGGLEMTTVHMLANEFDKYLAVRLWLTRRTSLNLTKAQLDQGPS